MLKKSGQIAINDPEDWYNHHSWERTDFVLSFVSYNCLSFPSRLGNQGDRKDMGDQMQTKR